MAISKCASTALVLAGVLLAGCAEGNDGAFITGSLTGAPEAKADPACLSLASRIEALRKDGVPAKIEKAAAKRYRMTHADLGKADQLTKINAEFQARCSTVKTASAPTETPPSDKATKTPKRSAKAGTSKKAN